ncbi:hypothetical protein HDC93_000266 [Streptomyces sp. AK010]|nr:hypothetical protein [Streptomyces sp. AK010]
MSAGLDGLEAMVTHTATGKNMTPRWVCATRGWSREDWDAATERLRERGLLDASGDLTERGVALRRISRTRRTAWTAPRTSTRARREWPG